MKVTAREMKYLKRFADGGNHLSSEFKNHTEETVIYELVCKSMVSGNGHSTFPYRITEAGRTILEIEELKAKRDSICPEMLSFHRPLMARFGKTKKGWISYKGAGRRGEELKEFGMLDRFYGPGLILCFAPTEKGHDWISINNQIIELKERICNQE